MSTSAVAVGFAPHSGWSAVVAVGVAESAPYVAARGRIEMADAGDPASRQPYHAVQSLPLAEAERRLARWEGVAASMASRQLRALVERLAAEGRRVVGGGVLESSGRRGGSLPSILGSHALVHTADGVHFCDALAAAAKEVGVPLVRVPARVLEAEAASALGETTEVIRREIQALGRRVGPPWAADQKAAALVAWLALVRGARRRD
jgi:hypothetical protein